MSDIWIIIWAAVGACAVLALGIVGYRLAKATKRVSRSIDPIDQKIKALRLQVSALQRAVSDRQRRLNKDNYSSTKKGS